MERCPTLWQVSSESVEAGNLHIAIYLAYFLGAMSCWYGHVAGIRYASTDTVRQSKVSSIARTVGLVILMVTAIFLAHGGGTL